MNTIFAVLIFAVVYIFIASEKLEKTVVTLIGAFLMLSFRLVPFENAIAAIDLNVIFLLVGMMTCIYILSKTGFFEWMAIIVAKHSKGEPIAIMVLFLVITAVFSAFLDNVTTIILLAPVTILIAGILEISPVPFLICEVIASNIGGTATLIGDPPNILIGLQADLTFNDFLINLTPVTIIVFLFFLGTVYFIFRKKIHIPENIKSRVTEAIPHLAIIDRPNMIRALWVLGLIFLGFLTHGITEIEPGIIALGGSMLMMIVCRSEIDSTFMRVEWGVIFFFIGLFIITAGLEYTGAIQMIAQGVINMAGTNMFLLCMIILVGSALISSCLDNIPFVITMIPMVKQLIIYLTAYYGITNAAEIQAQIAQPLWWSLALGACLGGNGTLIGATANVVMAKISDRNKHHISFLTFSKYGFPFMVQSILISAVYLWLKYFFHR
ncbi:ArsB/NhaD family transporter [bacterium]|nr:ArsB/NhaD family transporter [bacterium]